MKHVRKAGAAIASAAMLLGLAAALATPASAATAGDSAGQAAAVTPAAQRVYLGHEEDKCSGTLSGKPTSVTILIVAVWSRLTALMSPARGLPVPASAGPAPHRRRLG